MFFEGNIKVFRIKISYGGMHALMVILIGKANPGWAGISGDRPLFSGVDSLEVEICKGGS